MKPALGNRAVPSSPCAIFLALCLALLLNGCNNSASAPPPDTIPPTAPTGLVANPVSPTQINLSWTASTDNVGVTGYKVERCQGAGCSNFTQIATPATTTFNDTGLTASTSYSYRVRATDAAGNLSSYSSSNSVSTLSPPIVVTLSLMAASVQAGIGTQKFTAMLQNDTQNKGVTWTLTQAGANCSPGCGAISSNTSLSITYTAPSNPPNPTVVTLTATSVADTSKFQAAAITVTPPVSVVVSPTPVNVQFNAIQFFTATVQNDAANAGVQWTLSQSGSNCSPACGTLLAGTSLSGAAIKYTGPSGVPVNPAVTLTAASVTDPARIAPAVITVTVNPGTTAVSISPARAAIATWQTQSFTPTVTGASDMTVTWQVDGVAGGNSASLGTIDANGKYTPPTSGTIAGSHTITATSNADVTKTATAPIGVTDLAGVFTYHNNLSRDGTNTHEFALTTSSVAAATFGKLFSCTVDGAIYGQPLWVPNLTINAAKHNVIIVATQHNSVYAFDADANPCVTLWQAKLTDNAHGGSAGETSVPSGPPNNLVGAGFGDITPEVGVTGTPVIDPATNIIYVVSKSVIASGPTFFQRLHALDLTTGLEKLNGNKPVTISATFPGNFDGGSTVAFDPRNENQRPGLALVNGVIYIAWSAHEDQDQYHGWVIGYNASTLAQVPNAVFNSTPNDVGGAGLARGGIWMGGGAPAADSNFNLYLLTGNGTFDADTGGSNYGDSTVKLSTASGLTVADWFTPADQASLNGGDTDHGSGGAAILLSVASGNYVIGGGKEGNLFLLNRNSMGHYGANVNPVNSNAVQIFNVGNGIFATSAFWNNSLYIAPMGGTLQAYPFNTATGLFNTGAATATGPSFGFPGATPSISASSASANGIVWAIDASQYCTPQSPGCGSAVLHAFDAGKLSTELWNSSQAAADQAGFAVKFAVATVANGRVYIGTRGNDNGAGTSSVLGELDVYGLKPN